MTFLICRRCLFFLGLASGLACLYEPARAEQLITGISSEAIAIESNFVGAELVLFGTIERDVNTVARRYGYDIAVVVTGPLSKIVVRKKERFAGIWVNRQSSGFVSVPSFMAVLSNRSLENITTPATLATFNLGLRNLKLNDRARSDLNEPTKLDQFDEALLRLMGNRELYVENGKGVEFLSDSLFSARIKVPAHVPVGTFTAEVFLFGDGALLQRQKIDLKVHKSGFEQLAYTLATQHSLVYGVLAVIMAVFAGWSASIVFRKD